MHYTENQIDEYVQAYFRSNSDAIKDRLRFLLELYDDEDRLIPTDVWYCFEEARHTFMMGDYVASMIMCAVTCGAASGQTAGIALSRAGR